MSQGAKWLYLDLDSMGYALTTGKELPKKVSRLRENYDIATIASAVEIQDYIDLLGDFFLRAGGILWAGGAEHNLLKLTKGKWKQKFLYFFEKQ